MKATSINLPLILASTSPRRQQLLSLADIAFDVLPVDVDESIFPDESATHYIQRMVSAKAAAASELLKLHDNPNSNKKIVITADTIGVLANSKRILVKPINKADAFDMWSQMSGKEHHIWTAVQLNVVNSQGNIINTQNILEKTSVCFIELSNQDMEKYWQSGEPQDKAGGYAIQGKGAVWVKSINGSYTNVVGLPLAQTVSAIKQFNDN